MNVNAQPSDLPVVVARAPQMDVIPIGAGRTLGAAYLAGGRYIGSKVNRLAHHMGHGPDSARERIEQQLQNEEKRLLRTDDLGRDVSRNLQKDCLRLMKYALP